MKKTVKKKPRQEHIYATTANEVDNITISYDAKTDSISFETEVKDIYNEMTYERPKGPKVISRTPQNRPDLTFDHNRSVENNYDIIFALDTNTKEIKGEVVSITGIVQVQKIFAVDGNEL